MVVDCGAAAAAETFAPDSPPQPARRATAATADATSTTLFDFTFTNPTPTSDDAYHRATLPAIHRIRRRAGF